MAFELVSDKQQGARRWSWVDIALVIGFFSCLLVGAGALFGIFLIEDVDPVESLNEISYEIQTDRIIPTLTLMELAGDPADSLFKQSLLAGELESAYAILLFESQLTNTQRVNMLLQLAKRFGQLASSSDDSLPIQSAIPFQNPSKDRAVHLYRLARATLILDTTLNPLERGRLLIQCAEGLLLVNQREDALETAIQATHIGENTPDLLPAQRSQIFNSLQPIARQLAEQPYTQRLNELQRNPYIATTGSLIPEGWMEELVQLSKPLLSERITLSMVARQQAARALAERIFLTGGVDFEPERQALAQALLVEDQVRRNHYQQSLTASLTLEQRLQEGQTHSTWLLLKSRITLGGFGLLLVPEWAGTSELTGHDLILQELTGVMTQINAVLDVLANDQSAPIEQATLYVESLMWLALQYELGFYPNLSPTELDERLRASQVEMGRLGTPLALPVGYDAQSAFPGFRIQELR